MQNYFPLKDSVMLSHSLRGGYIIARDFLLKIRGFETFLGLGVAQIGAHCCGLFDCPHVLLN